ncbi:MAG: hypothetical protein OEW17_10150 [Gemmatimonadota bacterium]|nr:hypothetical protein [Gemmatimonadota bacterium]MDH4349158.1 hypothetical protein [Gemmatimonadota bacterium]MDH5283463.1 hypothetical protein [Gemmatimonadota bacterium]
MRVPGLAAVASLLLLAPVALPSQQLDPAANPPAAPKAAAAARERFYWPDPYPLDRAWRTGELDALAGILELEGAGNLGGQARREHHRVLLALLEQVGDSRYAAALAQLWPQNHLQVLRALSETAGEDSLSLPAVYPLSFGPRRPGEPSVQECAARISAAAAGDTLSRLVTRIERQPGGEPVPIAPDAPARVELRVWVGASGVPLLSRVGFWYPADSAALAAARQAVATWRFTPASALGCGIPNLYEVRLRP